MTECSGRGYESRHWKPLQRTRCLVHYRETPASKGLVASSTTATFMHSEAGQEFSDAIEQATVIGSLGAWFGWWRCFDGQRGDPGLGSRNLTQEVLGPITPQGAFTIGRAAVSQLKIGKPYDLGELDLFVLREC